MSMEGDLHENGGEGWPAKGEYRVQRRTVLAGLFGALALVPSGLFEGATRIPAPNAMNLWSGRRSVEMIGRRYLEQASHERDVGFLKQAVFRGRGGFRSIGDTHRHVAECARREFADGDVVVVDGWILAPVEARFCALATLT